MPDVAARPTPTAPLVRRGPLLRALLAATAPLSLSACPAPIAHVDTIQSPVVGTIERADGAPLAGVAIAVVDVRGIDDRCGATPAATTHADSAGHFTLPGRQQRFDRIWIVPNLDLVAPRYDLCVAIGDTMRTAYHGQVVRSDPAAADTVACVAWDWRGDERVSCSGAAQRWLLTGGRWRARGDSASGHYRVLLARDPRAPANEGRFRETPPRVFVQWVRPLAGSRHEVRETAELPVDEGIYALSRVTIEPLDAGWIVRIRGYQHAFMNDMAGAETVYQVDAPGEVRLMRAP